MEEVKKKVTCDKCKWVHFQVSRTYVAEHNAVMDTYFATLSPEEKKEMYGSENPGHHDYEHCFFCAGSYKDFHDSTPEEIPYGSTIGPILDRLE